MEWYSHVCFHCFRHLGIFKSDLFVIAVASPTSLRCKEKRRQLIVSIDKLVRGSRKTQAAFSCGKDSALGVPIATHHHPAVSSYWPSAGDVTLSATVVISPATDIQWICLHFLSLPLSLFLSFFQTPVLLLLPTAQGHAPYILYLVASLKLLYSIKLDASVSMICWRAAAGESSVLPLWFHKAPASLFWDSQGFSSRDLKYDLSLFF